MHLSDLTQKQLRQLAAKMGDRGVETSGDTLRGIANGNRGASAARAIEIERAALDLGWAIRRETLNSGCAMCEFAKTCRAAKKTCK